MLHEFLTSNREELISRCRQKAAKRFDPPRVLSSASHGVPLFLKQLVDVLRLEQTTPVREASTPGAAASASEISRAAATHGAEMLRLGYSVDQVVHDYGDVCQSVTEVAVEQNTAVSADEFRTLNRCLDNAIADAVTSFGLARQTMLNDTAETLHGRLNSFSEEHGRLVDIAMWSYSAIKTGNIGVTGATGTLLLHALSDLQSLTVRTWPEIFPRA